VAQSSGLHRLSEADLTRLARAIARESMPLPITRAGLVLAQFGHLEGELDTLVGHDRKTALAIVSAVLRERGHRASGGASLAWSGPALTGAGARAPYELLIELIATAERSIMFTGVELVRDARLLRSLHAAQRGRALQVKLLLAASDASLDNQGLLAQALALFHEHTPWPELYVPDRARMLGPMPVCMLADKCRGLLLAGAPAEPELDERLVCAGFLLEHADVVAALQSQWEVLIESDALLPLTAASEA
jgi:hypothetical protein